MKTLLVGVVVFCLLVPTFALAGESLNTRAFVVAVDLKAKSMTIRHKVNEDQWKETALSWDGKTQWIDEGSEIDGKKAPTEPLSNRLKSGSKVMVRSENGLMSLVVALVSEAPIN
jgi:hypothetical protein